MTPASQPANSRGRVATATDAGHPRVPLRNAERALLVAAGTVLQRGGPAAVTVRAVAVEASVAPMGVYTHFGSKEGLLAALTAEGHTILGDVLGDVLSDRKLGRNGTGGSPDPVQNLRALARGYRQFALSHPHHYRLMFTAGAASAPLGQCTDGATHQVLLPDVVAAMATGALRPGDAEQVAHHLWAGIQGRLLLELNGQICTRNPARAYERLIGLIIAGLSQQPPTTNGLSSGLWQVNPRLGATTATWLGPFPPADDF